ncbi:MAG: hypothetical protein MUP03_02075 [Anaerolineales bacterium]|nr:hypothetical protein [Anaerolineales bacterium]
MDDLVPLDHGFWSISLPDDLLKINVTAKVSVILPAPVSPRRVHFPNGVAGLVREPVRSLQRRPLSAADRSRLTGCLRQESPDGRR